jgi:pilus assembly protein Flp/PilA
MRLWLRRAALFLRREDGPTAVEYAIMLALIILVVFATVQTLGGNANNKFSDPNLRSALGS